MLQARMFSYILNEIITLHYTLSTTQHKIEECTDRSAFELFEEATGLINPYLSIYAMVASLALPNFLLSYKCTLDSVMFYVF